MKGRDGTILVTTLWILALLTLLALGIGIRMGIDIKLIGFSLNSSKAHYLAKAGLRKTMALLEKDSNKNIDSLNEIWSCGFDFDPLGAEENVLNDIALGEGAFTVSYESKDNEGNSIDLYGASDEEGKLNINELDSDALIKLPDFSNEIASAILDWRDEDDVAGNKLAMTEGAEDDDYEELDYECKDAPFSVPEELMLVKGITEEIYDGVKDIITVYGNSKAVNINTATQEVFAALIIGEFEELPGKIIQYRNGDDGLPGTEDDNVFTDTRTIVVKLKTSSAGGGLDATEEAYLNVLISDKNYFKVSSDTFRIVSRGEVRGGKVKKTIEVVYRRGAKESVPKILYYHED